MHKFKKLAAAAVVAVSLIIGVSLPALSQNTAGSINCDSDLILLWYTGERYFGFGAVQNVLAQTAIDPTTVLNLTDFNQGQFNSLFDALHRAQNPTTLTLPGITLNQNFVNAALAMMLMDDAAYQNTITSIQGANPAAGLIPASVPGEAPQCAQLRFQLQRFFAAVALTDMQSGFNLTFAAPDTAVPVPVSTEEAGSGQIIVPVVTEEAGSGQGSIPAPVVTEEASNSGSGNSGSGSGNSGSGSGNSGSGHGGDDSGGDDHDDD